MIWYGVEVETPERNAHTRARTGYPPLSDGSDIRILLYDGSDIGAPYLAPESPGKRPRTRSVNSRIRHALSHLGAGLRIGRPRGRG